MVHPLLSSILYLTGSSSSSSSASDGSRGAAAGRAGSPEGGGRGGLSSTLVVEAGQRHMEAAAGAACDFDGVRQGVYVLCVLVGLGVVS